MRRSTSGSKRAGAWRLWVAQCNEQTVVNHPNKIIGCIARGCKAQSLLDAFASHGLAILDIWLIYHQMPNTDAVENAAPIKQWVHFETAAATEAVHSWDGVPSPYPGH